MAALLSLPSFRSVHVVTTPRAFKAIGLVQAWLEGVSTIFLFHQSIPLNTRGGVRECTRIENPNFFRHVIFPTTCSSVTCFVPDIFYKNKTKGPSAQSFCLVIKNYFKQPIIFLSSILIVCIIIISPHWCYLLCQEIHSDLQNTSDMLLTDHMHVLMEWIQEHCGDKHLTCLLSIKHVI